MKKICPRFEVQLVRNGSVKYEVLSKGDRVTSSAAAARIVAGIAREDLESSPCEVFGVVTLDTKYKPIGVIWITKGTLNASLVHPREVFRPAIKQNAAAVILVHNHPSGDLVPSHADWEVTTTMKKAGHLLGIEVIDHIIVGHNEESEEWRGESLRELKPW